MDTNDNDELDLPYLFTDYELTLLFLRDSLSTIFEELTWLMQIVNDHIEELDEPETQEGQ